MPQNDAYGPSKYPADKARQGDVVLRSRRQRLIFIAGLALPVVLALLILLVMLRGHF